MIKNAIADKNGETVALNTDSGEDVGLVVATRDHKTYNLKVGFVTNSTYGSDMAQDAAFGGAPITIHNGLDDVAWTFAQSAGKWDEDSTDRFYAGAKSIKCDNAAVGEYSEYTNQDGGAGTDIDLTNYAAFSMWINTDKDWKTDSEVFFQGVVDGGLVGNSVDLSDYFDWSDKDVWYYVSILKADLGLSTTSIDAVRITQGAKGGHKAPKFYIDDLTLQQSGSPIAFSIKPQKGTWFHITTVHITMADNVDSEVDTGADTKVPTMYGLSYDKFLGMTPGAGLKLEGYRDGELIVGSSQQITSLGDMLSLPSTTITNAVADGTNTCISLERNFPVPSILKAEENDELRVTLDDDFSVLLMMKFSVMGYQETRNG